MTSPTIFAIFMLCSPDLLTCEKPPFYQLKQFINIYECLDFVNKEEENHKGEYVLLGRCVWRIVKEEK